MDLKFIKILRAVEINKENLKVHAALLAVGLVYGANYSIAKSPMPDLIPPFAFIVIRVSIALILFWTLSVFIRRDKIQHKRDYLRLVVCSIFGVAINQLMFFKGLSMTSTVSASVIMTANPIIVLIAAYLILREPVTRLKAVGIALGSAGAVMLILRNQVSWESGSFLGDFFIFINATSYGLYLVLVKPLMSRYHAVTISKWMFLFGIIWILPVGLGEFQTINWSSMPTEGWVSIAYVVVFTTVVAYLLNIWALKSVSPTVVSYYVYAQPLFATFIAILFLDEVPDLKVFLFAALIFAGVFLVSWKK